MTLRAGLLLLCCPLVGCATARVVRLNTGQGEPIVHILRRGVEPVAVSEQELRKAVAQQAPSVPLSERPLEHARQLFGMPERSGWYLYESRSHRLIASEPVSPRNLRLSLEDAELTRRYMSWCGLRWGGGDCLRDTRWLWRLPRVRC